MLHYSIPSLPPDCLWCVCGVGTHICVYVYVCGCVCVCVTVFIRQPIMVWWSEAIVMHFGLGAVGCRNAVFDFLSRH